MSPAAFAAGLLERGIELIERNNRLRVWPAHAYRTLTEAERAFRREHITELKALVRAGLTTLPANASHNVKARAIAHLRSYDRPGEGASQPTVSAHKPTEQRMTWDERAQVFVKDLGITI